MFSITAYYWRPESELDCFFKASNLNLDENFE